MSERDDGGPACAWCDAPAHIKQGRILLCQAHYRMSSMRARAKRDGKQVPTIKEIEAMVPAGMICCGCARQMHWLRNEGAALQATLQHDRNGGLRIICLACNTRHAQHPGDTYYLIPADSKWCPDCSQVLPRSAFVKDRSRPLGLKSYCRQCSSLRFKDWSVRHAAA